MRFRTQIPILKSSHQIDYTSKVVSLGSCFAVNISEKFDYFQFQNKVNPFGILFHPLAIERFLQFALDQKTFTEADIFFHNERWHCFDAHSDLSHADKNQLLQNLNVAAQSAGTYITESTHVIITLGTSWVYRNNTSQNLVANCHKVPSTEFSKELLSVETISESLLNISSLLQNANPDTSVIFTVSPVRHIKDGFPENQQSKANLISALHQVLRELSSHQPPATSHYFPSYEIMMDELRDYRFYAEDMLHPNQTAIDYIWERFAENWISANIISVMEEVASIRKNLAHRPFNLESESHGLFLSATQTKIESLTSRFPHMFFG